MKLFIPNNVDGGLLLLNNGENRLLIPEPVEESGLLVFSSGETSLLIPKNLDCGSSSLPTTRTGMRASVLRKSDDGLLAYSASL